MQSCRQSVTSRKISFAGRLAVAGKSERKLSDELIPSGSRYLHQCYTPKTRQQEETNVEPQLNHRPPTEQEEPKSQPRLADFGLGFPHTKRQFGKSKIVFSSFRLNGLIAGGGCIMLNTKTIWCATPVQGHT